MRAARATELAYAPDPWALFERLVDAPWCVFLNSGHPRATQGHYGILAAEPFVTLTTRGS